MNGSILNVVQFDMNILDDVVYLIKLEFFEENTDYCDTMIDTWQRDIQFWAYATDIKWYMRCT